MKKEQKKKTASGQKQSLSKNLLEQEFVPEDSNGKCVKSPGMNNPDFS